MLAERYFPDDPNTSLLKLRQLAELLAQLVATKVGLYKSPEESQYDLLRRLQDQGILPREIAQLFGEVRRAGNAASHAMSGDHRTALAALKITWQLGSGSTAPSGTRRSSPARSFLRKPHRTRATICAPSSPASARRSNKASPAHQETTQRLDAAEAKLREAKDEQTFWEQMASEAEAAKAALEQRLAAQQAETAAQPREAVDRVRRRGEHRGCGGPARRGRDAQADRRATPPGGLDRRLGDLIYSQGARPEKGKNLAIAEWPTHSGPADYVLFVGLTPVAVVEAKRKNIDVSAALQQAKRYSRGFMPSPETVLHAETGGRMARTAFRSSSRPTAAPSCGSSPPRAASGSATCAAREPRPRPRRLVHAGGPRGAARSATKTAAHEQLRHEPFNYGFALRHYQQAAIRAVEAAIAKASARCCSPWPPAPARPRPASR